MCASVCACVSVCLCVCVCSQASGSGATLSWDSSYFSYWQSTIQARYAVMRQLLSFDSSLVLISLFENSVTFIILGCVFNLILVWLQKF